MFDRNTFRSALIVEDDLDLGRAICDEVQKFATAVTWSTSLAKARSAMRSTFDLALIDIALPDGRAVGLVSELLARRPMPLVVAVSGVSFATEALELQAAGVHAFVPKPLDVRALAPKLEELLQAPRPLDSYAAMRVGHADLHDAQRNLRRSMLTQALARCQGNRASTARLLGVTRQAVQHMMREFEITWPTAQ